jgi:hypothetical protein
MGTTGGAWSLSVLSGYNIHNEASKKIPLYTFKKNALFVTTKVIHFNMVHPVVILNVILNPSVNTTIFL